LESIFKEMRYSTREEVMSKDKTKTVKAQLHSGAFVLGLAAGVALVLFAQQWQRTQSSAAKAAWIYRAPVLRASTVPRPLTTTTCPWSKPLVI
jgi:membrane-associated PAP2 superfamily phosphatase